MSGTWSYDGSLDALVVLAGWALERSEAPEAVANALAPEGELFGGKLFGHQEPSPLAPTHDAAEARKAARAVRSFSEELYDLVIKIWMSECPLELALLELCAEVPARGTPALHDRRDSRVRALAQAALRVEREIHRLIGLARFSLRSDGLYSAPVEPDHNVAAALMPTFSARFGIQDFAVVDVKRRLAFVSRASSELSLCGPEALDLLPDGSDADEPELWRRYFKATDNPSRRNPSLQKQLMPVRYWKHLVELRR
ncbi:MAG: TIGR03915 family putative DNA repair protein [Spirochaetaceae bacterium]|nr:TIGR03915 family putative DNA repair protein [Spirochaetaceae bacterium]